MITAHIGRFHPAVVTSRTPPSIVTVGHGIDDSHFAAPHDVTFEVIDRSSPRRYAMCPPGTVEKVRAACAHDAAHDPSHSHVGRRALLAAGAAGLAGLLPATAAHAAEVSPEQSHEPGPAAPYW